jgi:hypothetical protein
MEARALTFQLLHTGKRGRGGGKERGREGEREERREGGGERRKNGGRVIEQ